MISGERTGYFTPRSSARVSASRSRPPSTSFQLSIYAPSSSIVRLSGGIDPGVSPPTSVWCPRAAEKKSTRPPASSHTGRTTVMSGRCVPPL